MAAIGFQDWAIADPQTRKWDAGAARKRFRAWVSPNQQNDWEASNWEQFKRGHLWFDETAPYKQGSYKFLLVDVIDGEPKYVFRAAAASLSILRGGRAGAWTADKDRMLEHVEFIYRKFGVEFPQPGKEFEHVSRGEVMSMARHSGIDTGKEDKTFGEAIFQIKASESEDYPGGVCEGHAAIFDNVDRQGDVIRSGAFKKTLKENKGKFPLIDGHRVMAGSAAVIGKVYEAEEDDKGLRFKAFFSSVPSAQEVRTKVKEGIINTLSIGYQSIKDKIDASSNIRELLELRLYEISLVAVPANPKAKVTAIKGIDLAICPDVARPFDAELAMLRWKKYCGGALSDFNEDQLALFGKGFLLVDPNAATQDQAFRYPIVDVINGEPFLIRAAVEAASKDSAFTDQAKELLSRFPAVAVDIEYEDDEDDEDESEDDEFKSDDIQSHLSATLQAALERQALADTRRRLDRSRRFLESRAVGQAAKK